MSSTKPDKLYALVDCNNFYVSCERVFRPDLNNRPVVVLSNNDGCIVARSNEIKAMGIRNGSPFFKCKSELLKQNCAVLSSNYPLYADISSRIMSLLSNLSLDIEVYSIDEAFLLVDGFTHISVMDYARKIQEKVKKYISMPVSIGIGNTKTLAKIANSFAKKNHECNGVFIMDEYNRETVLKSTTIGDVWGVGFRYASRLSQFGINNALDLSKADENFIRKTMTVMGLRTLWELNGKSCIELETIRPDKKAVTSSRSFGKPVIKIEDLKEALSYYISRACEKIRQENSLASVVTVFLSTNRFKENRYSNAITFSLVPPTSFTPKILKLSLKSLEKIYRPGYEYIKTGIILSGLTKEFQGNLFFKNTQNESHNNLMETIDKLNKKYGSKTITFGSEGLKREWYMKQEYHSPHYTTRWNELPVVFAK